MREKTRFLLHRHCLM